MVLLEEIKALPLRLQAQLDGWLEELQNRRMAGSGEPDFRLAATTTVPLEQMVREGKFRGDLCYRISVIQISLPPLRQACLLLQFLSCCSPCLTVLLAPEHWTLFISLYF